MKHIATKMAGLSGSEKREIAAEPAVEPPSDLTRMRSPKQCSVKVAGEATDKDVEVFSGEFPEIGRSEMALCHFQKLEAVSHLTGGFIHDINNILQIIYCNTGMIKTKLVCGDPIEAELESVIRASERAAHITDRLLRLSHRKEYKAVYVHTNNLIKNLFEMMRCMIGENIEFDLQLSDQMKAVYADAPMLEHALINLCINARDAMPDGGRLTVYASVVTADSEFLESHPWAVPGDYVEIGVTDTGKGVPNEIKKRIFDPYVTTKTRGEGTGLGLSIVNRIVKQQGGHVSLASTGSHGTTFVIYLPAAESVAANEVEQGIEVNPDGSETILVADDAEDILEILVVLLEKRGYSVIKAGNGADALKIFNSQREHIDLVLLDIMMPGMNGLDVFEAIRSTSPHMPVVFCTGHSADQMPLDLLRRDEFKVIHKPFDSKDLYRTVREALDKN